MRVRQVLPVLFWAASSVCIHGQVSPVFSCSSSSIIKLIRGEGRSELLPDIVLDCTGGTPTGPNTPIPAVNVQVFLNTSITTPELPGTTTTPARSGALLLIDDPKSSQQVICATANGVCTATGGQPYPNVYAGATAAVNSVVWLGIPIDPPGPNVHRIIRLTNIRADASQLGISSVLIPTQINAFVSTTGSTAIPINPQNLAVAFILSSLVRDLRDATNTATLAASGAAFPVGQANSFQRVATVRFGEGFTSAFLARSNTRPPDLNTSPIPDPQSIAGAALTSETGFYNPSLGSVPNIGNYGGAGLADQGVRLVARFSGLQPGASIYVDLTNVGANITGDAARLTSSEVGAFSATPATPGLPSANIAQLTVDSNGGATAVWEVLAADFNSKTNFDFGVYYSSSTIPIASGGSYPPAQVTLSYAPVVSPTPITKPPVPRFVSLNGPLTLFNYLNPTPVILPPPPAPALLVNPAQLNFVATVGGPSPAAQSLSLTSSFADVSFNFSTSSGGVLPITVTPSNGVVPGSATVSVNTMGLAPGNYKDVVTINAGGTSNGSVAVGIIVTVRSAPVITSLDPRSTPAGSGPVNLLVNGRGFLPGASVNFGDASLTPTFTTGGQLNVTVPANLLTQVRIVPVTVTNLDGAVSNSADFVVDQFRILSLNPDRRTATALGFNLTVTGNGFLPGAMVRFGDTSLTPTLGAVFNTTSLTVNVPAAAIGTAGTVQVSVSNPNGQVSNTLPFIVRPVPVIDSVNPSSIPLGAAATTITITGRNFFDGVTVNWNGQAVPTTFGGATQLTAVVPASLLTQTGSVALTALTPDGVRSGPFTLPVGAATINIPNLSAGDGNVNVVITGSGFGPNTQVQFACPPAAPVTLALTGVTSTSLTATIPGSLLTQPCSSQIIVIGGGGPTIINVPILPPPRISGLSQSTATAGGASFTITVNGTGFESGSTIRWGGTPLVTTLVNGSLQGAVPVSLLTLPGPVNITVVGPRGSTSNVVTFSVALPALTGVGVTVPATSPSNTDQSGTVNFGAAFPADLNGSLVLTFRGDGGLPDDPAIQFPNGSRTLAFAVPANTRPTVNFTLKAGTLAGVITITPQFTSGGAAVTATGLTPVTITVARTAPVLTAVSCTRGAGSFNVITDGFTNTRQATQGVFTFTGDNLTTSSLTVDATAPFATFAGGSTTGGTFRYTQTFNVQGNVNAVQSVGVRITNSAGQSAERSATCQ